MKKVLAASVLLLLGLATSAASARAALKGDYLEVRSADVYTGPCFANSEENLAGNQAILAWKIRQGDWRGTDLAGFGVVAVVQAQATLGDTTHDPYPAKVVLIVDSRANAAQRAALIQFAKAAGGKLLANVVRVDSAPIELTAAEHGSVKLVAGSLARVETRSLCAGDHLCGNEEVYYPPLTRVNGAMPAFALEEAFNGQGLGVVWDRKDTRGAFIATFAL
ncbi:MAG: hypothetical protein DMG22_22590 [Acidobacteria bacterium]|nr:MAG: hypothetical protein DMG22_22590 [Acidobacteriota bacterium]